LLYPIFKFYAANPLANTLFFRFAKKKKKKNWKNPKNEKKKQKHFDPQFEPHGLTSTPPIFDPALPNLTLLNGKSFINPFFSFSFLTPFFKDLL
jgi:hypothetical protein